MGAGRLRTHEHSFVADPRAQGSRSKEREPAMSVPHSLGRRALATALAATVALLPTYAFAQRAGRGANNPIRNIPVSSTDGSFTGSFSIERFQAVGNALVAVGDISGKFADGTPVNQQSVAWPVQSIQGVAFGQTASLEKQTKAVPATWNPAQAPTIIQTQATCDVLNLVLGPLHLDLLGLVVDLNQVVLDITAESGAGNLLGNLLCAVVGLLDPVGSLAAIAQALTNLANALNGLIGALP
jgi:hypothetical protein